MKSTDQLDLLDDDPRRLAEANRVAAQTATVNPYFSPAEQREHAAHYLAEAERLERLAAMCGGCHG